MLLSTQLANCFSWCSVNKGSTAVSVSLAVKVEVPLILQDNFDFISCVLGILLIYKCKMYAIFFNA